MAKKDKKAGIPIEFSDPGFGRRPRIPIPINQPNWKYKTYNSKPTVAEWALTVIL